MQQFFSEKYVRYNYGKERERVIRENSFGIVPVRRKGGVWQVFLICHQSGDYWSFPKGRANDGETPMETARRELAEETGLQIKRFLTETPITENYTFSRDGKKIHKKVAYYVAEVEGNIFLQLNEIKGGMWVPIFEAGAHITYPEAQHVCHQVLSIFEKQ